MDCLFCKIVAGEIPSRQVYADEHAVAFLDVAPIHRGHTLVVPRHHVGDLVDPEADLAEITPAVQQVARLLKTKLDADGINIFSSAGKAAGQEIFHLHVHVVPRYADRPGLRGLTQPDPDADADMDALLAELTADA